MDFGISLSLFFHQREKLENRSKEFGMLKMNIARHNYGSNERRNFGPRLKRISGGRCQRTVFMSFWLLSSLMV